MVLIFANDASAGASETNALTFRKARSLLSQNAAGVRDRRLGVPPHPNCIVTGVRGISQRRHSMPSLGDCNAAVPSLGDGTGL